MHINTNGAWTLPEQIARLALEQPDGKALVEMNSNGGWLTTTWGEYWQTVHDLAKGLISLGAQPGEHIAMVGNNRRDWVICQMGISAATAVPAPIYVTNTMDQMAYITKHCEARIAICDNQQQLTKFLTAIEHGLIELEHIITMDDLGNDHPLVITLADVIRRGTLQADDELDRRMKAVKPDDLALLIYTSGTTGVPKGAMCTHRGIEAIGLTFQEKFPKDQNTPPDHNISYLPLCHVAEQAFTNFVGLRAASVTYFCADMNKIKDYLVAVRPQTFFAVPRVWEKIEAALRAKLLTATGIKAKLASWARRVEFESATRSMETGMVIDSFQRRLANKLVIAKIKSAIGFDRIYLAGAGAAPMSHSTLEFFASIGILIHEGLGMTETTGLATAQPLGMPRFGTVGQAFSSVEMQIADDGEILLRGNNMVPGYLHMPEASAELRNDDDWMYTGDLGTIDEDGFLTITGRKKDLLITAGGKNVAPAEMENHLQGIPGVGQAIVVGDRKPYLSALLALEEDALPDLCKAADVPLAPLSEIAGNKEVRAFLEARVESDCNGKVARYQTIKKIKVLPHMLSIEAGELTPTMKIKRNVINEKYAALIEAMYTT